MDILKNEKDSHRRTQLSQFISSYLSRVEAIKAKLNHTASTTTPRPGARDYHMSKTLPSHPKPKHLHLEDLINEALGNAQTSHGTINPNQNSDTSTASSASGGDKERGNGVSLAGAKLTEYEQTIMSDMLDSSPGVTWDDIAGRHTKTR